MATTTFKSCAFLKYFFSPKFRRFPLLNQVRMNGVYPGVSFTYDDLQIMLATQAQKMPLPDPATLKFGETFSDHMFEVEWTQSNGWGSPRIVPLHYFQCHPGSKIFHYAQAVFEGMKAFRSSENTVALFRPEMNMQRLLRSAERASLPLFNSNELLKCLKKLISIDKAWVPHLIGSSLYIRPTFIGIQNSLGVTSSNQALLYIITCPVGPYFKTGNTTPISLLADPNFVRAWPGGAGDKKLASNYAPTLYVQKLAEQQGLQQVLWLIGEDHEIAEVGAMNVFFFLRNGSDLELVTPPLDGTILPGVVRQSILDLTREWKEFKVSERVITMNEIIKTSKEERLLEGFVCGTASSVCPISSIRYLNEDIHIPTMTRDNALYQRLYKALANIQYGRVPSKWSVTVD